MPETVERARAFCASAGLIVEPLVVGNPVDTGDLFDTPLGNPCVKCGEDAGPGSLCGRCYDLWVQPFDIKDRLKAKRDHR